MALAGLDPSLPASSLCSQVIAELLFQGAFGLDEQALVDRFVRHLQALFVGVLKLLARQLSVEATISYVACPTP